MSQIQPADKSKQELKNQYTCCCRCHCLRTGFPAGDGGTDGSGRPEQNAQLSGAPQRKQQKLLEEMRKALKKGDKVVTAGGIYGVIADVDETTVLMRVDGDVKIRVDKNSITKDPRAEAAAQQK